MKLNGHRARFERWQKKLEPPTAYLVAQILEKILPLFIERGYIWYSDFAGDVPDMIGANSIPLQIRKGTMWPTIQLNFGNRGQAFLNIDFCELPEKCYRINKRTGVLEEIPRILANVVEGHTFFSLCKGRGCKYDCTFGTPGFFGFFFRKRKLDSEIERLKILIPWLLDLLDKGIPPEWYADKVRKQLRYYRVHSYVKACHSIGEIFSKYP